MLVRSWEQLPSRLIEEPQSSHVSMPIQRDMFQVLMKLHSHVIRGGIFGPVNYASCERGIDLRPENRGWISTHCLH